MNRAAIRVMLLTLATGEGAQLQLVALLVGLAAWLARNFLAVQVVGTVLSFLYFAVPAMVLSRDKPADTSAGER